jgi:hypothetical protein
LRTRTDKSSTGRETQLKDSPTTYHDKDSPTTYHDKETLMKTRTLIVIGAVLLAALSRLMPHPPNFAPITAMALFGAATLTDRRLGILTPLVALFVSDMCIEVANRMGWMTSWGIYSGMWVMYVAYSLIILLGLLLRKHRTAPAIAGATLAGSVVFFLVSNFAVWATGSLDIKGIPYPHTLEGLIYCYREGIPFFRNTLLGDVFYSTVLFGGFALAERWIPALRRLPAKIHLREPEIGKTN